MPGASFADVQDAAKRIAPFVHRTPVLTSTTLDAWAGATLFLKCEHLQRIGAFKYRGATNAVQSLDDDVARRGVAAHSSGNHAAALTRAAAIGSRPSSSCRTRCAVKAAVLAYGRRSHRVTTRPSAATLAEVVADRLDGDPSFDDDRVIAGAGTAAPGLMRDPRPRRRHRTRRRRRFASGTALAHGVRGDVIAVSRLADGAARSPPANGNHRSPAPWPMGC
jgi:threonine dehydratase